MLSWVTHSSTITGHILYVMATLAIRPLVASPFHNRGPCLCELQKTTHE